MMNTSPPSCPGVARRCRAFTLVELLLSMTIFSIVLLTTASMLDSTMNQLRIAEARFSQFQEAQAAFESMNLRLAGCELNPYYDYVYPGNNLATVPTSYRLFSDLHFISGPLTTGSMPLLPSPNRPGHGIFFHGTYGLSDVSAWSELPGLMNSWGYYVEFGDDTADRAAFLTTGGAAPRYRFRLKELQVPAEDLRTYALKLSNPATQAGSLYDWFRTPAGDTANSRTVAENIVAMIVTPLRPEPGGTLSNDLAPTYTYDTRAFQQSSTALAERTRHKLPPLVRVTVVALDEVSAARLQEQHGSTMPDLGLQGLFTNSSLYQQNLETLEAALNAQKLRYRVFTNTIRLRNSRWTSSY